MMEHGTRKSNHSVFVPLQTNFSLTSAIKMSAILSKSANQQSNLFFLNFFAASRCHNSKRYITNYTLNSDKHYDGGRGARKRTGGSKPSPFLKFVQFSLQTSTFFHKKNWVLMQAEFFLYIGLLCFNLKICFQWCHPEGV